MKLVGRVRDAAGTPVRAGDVNAAAEAAALAAFAARPAFSADGGGSGPNGDWSAVHKQASLALEQNHPAAWCAAVPDPLLLALPTAPVVRAETALPSERVCYGSCVLAQPIVHVEGRSVALLRSLRPRTAAVQRCCQGWLRTARGRSGGVSRRVLGHSRAAGSEPRCCSCTCAKVSRSA
eukprot:COSAG06_NODE_4403_length_4293_cov_27.038251_4_plen_179_part_00